ncbi:hypothetical protein [Streptomyces sp. NPDC047014]|uniref:hypothetical protein n=1 Tax=Streptomyces sp. NPDC047014 TaxID=3155736 RepID=UPI0033C41370
MPHSSAVGPQSYFDSYPANGRVLPGADTNVGDTHEGRAHLFPVPQRTGAWDAGRSLGGRHLWADLNTARTQS